MPRSPRRAAVLACLLVLAVVSPLAPAHAAPPEPLADYQPAAHCAPKAKPGTRVLARWLERRYGSRTTISRSCTPGGDVSSEHQEGRAIDWFADARTPAGRASARALLDALLAPDAAGNVAAKARRMGVMYVIWNDRMYAAWDAFRPGPYLSSSCRNRRTCSPTLRHRDHVHISLTRRAARGLTSWYLAR
ncbi:hypothetical protein ABFT23_22380 [Nocardioides sp. C4-1]|uniref:hypothetical protein n=1 Tax=Nocardioides sp. C4-1 TaxID=3151851 RepID=UPI003265DA3E